MSDVQTLRLGAFALQSGETVADAELAYATFGTLNADKSNVIVYPTSFAMTDADTRWLIGPGRILDSSRYFVVIPNMFGNGASTSPSTLPRPAEGAGFPRFSHLDNVVAQRRLLRDHLGVERIALIYGWSMGAQQALHWAAVFPDMVARVLALCGTARTSEHNKVFLEGVRAALIADEAWQDGCFVRPPVRGLRAIGRIYAGWALSQSFYRERIFAKLGYPDLESYLAANWDGNFARRDAHDILSMIDTWQAADISANQVHGGDLAGALSAITARTYHISCATDLYFRSKDIREEAGQIPNGTFFELESPWGHRAGNPIQSPVDATAIGRYVAQILDE
jgi:homoserine O-acetyltransferase